VTFRTINRPSGVSAVPLSIEATPRSTTRSRLVTTPQAKSPDPYGLIRVGAECVSVPAFHATRSSSFRVNGERVTECSFRVEGALRKPASAGSTRLSLESVDARPDGERERRSRSTKAA
jgi:hypothetical protein